PAAPAGAVNAGGAAAAAAGGAATLGFAVSTPGASRAARSLSWTAMLGRVSTRPAEAARVWRVAAGEGVTTREDGCGVPLAGAAPADREDPAGAVTVTAP